MKVRTVYWKLDGEWSTLEKFAEISSAYFKTGSTAYWKLLISTQEVQVKRGRPVIIKVRKVELPAKTAVSPLSIQRHALGTVVDVYGERLYRVEEQKNITHVVFLPVEDGTVEIDDLLGVVKVYPMNVAPAENVGAITAPEVAMSLKEQEANLVYVKDDEVVREKRILKEYWYRRWHIGEWYPLIAREEAEVTKGEAVKVRIENLELPENTIPVPMSIMTHALGTVIDIAHMGRPRAVEERKLITHAVFLPALDGRVEKGDLLGVLNVYYISSGERAARIFQHLTGKVEANHVYWKDGRIRRRSIVVTPFSFRRSSIGRFEPVIAEESVELAEGEVGVVKIRDLEFPSGTITQPLTSFNHAFGSIVDLCAFSPPKMVEEDRVVTHAVVLSPKGGRIEKGDLLGAVAVYNISVLREPEFLISKYRELMIRAEQ
ncbi:MULTISPECIES: DUF22 domain-containing protein [Archaeoglobus]|jgi:hypothetical protein|uniref:DUF22 domain-containing protein n=2 Tax=Archaeoglobus fulgidus TaxID=2234 RepID=O30157_ARCFU|nr:MULTISPECIES: DUF22 domain-containing protein [Archaeoglobus]AAB91157.1 predicted coding region AF_0079 [Archaeoglobus fulgidus DSM 4304]AIG96919.1 hypothetical protein AFULGI_00000740 [Archaeoglobus fulgidus DSM 8774]MDI3497104.1 hypothetical protein [Archaeoglobus sp.]